MFQRIRRVVAVLTLAVAGVQGAAAASDDKMLVILTSAETETQAMTLVLSNQAAKRGTHVHLLLCGPAGDIALKDAPAETAKVITPKGMTVQSLLSALKTKGAVVDVCAIYLPNRKLAADALVEGVHHIHSALAVCCNTIGMNNEFFPFSLQEPNKCIESVLLYIQV